MLHAITLSGLWGGGRGGKLGAGKEKKALFSFFIQCLG